jgi:hypothetical protein
MSLLRYTAEGGNYIEGLVPIRSQFPDYDYQRLEEIMAEANRPQYQLRATLRPVEISPDNPVGYLGFGVRAGDVVDDINQVDLEVIIRGLSPLLPEIKATDYLKQVAIKRQRAEIRRCQEDLEQVVRQHKVWFDAGLLRKCFLGEQDQTIGYHCQLNARRLLTDNDNKRANLLAELAHYQV